MVGAALVNFCFQLVVLLGALRRRRRPASGWCPTSTCCWSRSRCWSLVVWATALGLLLAAANVYLRDLQYLVEWLLLAGSG